MPRNLDERQARTNTRSSRKAATDSTKETGESKESLDPKNLNETENPEGSPESEGSKESQGSEGPEHSESEGWSPDENNSKKVKKGKKSKKIQKTQKPKKTSTKEKKVETEKKERPQRNPTNKPKYKPDDDFSDTEEPKPLKQLKDIKISPEVSAQLGIILHEQAQLWHDLRETTLDDKAKQQKEELLLNLTDKEINEYLSRANKGDTASKKGKTNTGQSSILHYLKKKPEEGMEAEKNGSKKQPASKKGKDSSDSEEEKGTTSKKKSKKDEELSEIPLEPLGERMITLTIPRKDVSRYLKDNNSKVQEDNKNSATKKNSILKSIAAITGVPARELHRIARQKGENPKGGRKRGLDLALEQELTRYIIQLSKLGRPLTKSEVLLLANYFSGRSDKDKGLTEGWLYVYTLRIQEQLKDSPDLKHFEIANSRNKSKKRSKAKGSIIDYLVQMEASEDIIKLFKKGSAQIRLRKSANSDSEEEPDYSEYSDESDESPKEVDAENEEGEEDVEEEIEEEFSFHLNDPGEDLNGKTADGEEVVYFE